MAIENSKNVITRNLDKIMNESFAKYAKYIIQDRALPDIRDGLKPVQRRILYGMYNLGILSDRPYKKSARSVGEVIGKFHPHGDSSIYEAMVRLSQEWKNNIPLLDMHGNKGSIDGDSAAAMRYTECRLSKTGQLLLNNIEKETVIFIPNFDDSEIEPSYLPALVPTLLINGATGIAAGYATNIPPFNPGEVLDSIIHRIDNPNCNIKDISKIIKGPDFPTGGIIQGKDGIIDAYETGKGKFIIRAKFIEKEVNKKMKQLIITEIPYETNKSTIIKAIDDLVYDNKINGIIETRDETDKHGISIVIDIEASKSFEVIKNFLYKNTPLQVSYAINFVCIVDRKPILSPILFVIDSYLKHAYDIIKKTSIFDLKKAEKRNEILEGLIKAISILDDVIELIRKSTSKDDAKTNLSNKFGFTEIQSEAIVQLRLYKLTSTDVKSLREEKDGLNLRIEELKQLLNSDSLLKNHLKKILREYKTLIEYPRKTKIENEIQKIVINDADVLENKDVVVMVTKDGYIKSTSKRSIESSEYGDINLKSGDMLINMFNSNTLDQIILITNIGQYISIPCHKIKNLKYKDTPEHLNNILTINSSDEVVCGFNTKNVLNIKKKILICTKLGVIKRVDIRDLNFSKTAKSSTIMNLKNDDKIISSQLLEDKINYDVICLTKNGLALRFDVNEVPVVGRSAAGVKAMKLLPNDEIISCAITINAETDNLLIVSNRGLKRIYPSLINKTKRANIGRMVMTQTKTNPSILINAFSVYVKDTLNILDSELNHHTFLCSSLPLTDLDNRFNDIKIKEIVHCYKDEYLSKNLNNENESNDDDEIEDLDNVNNDNEENNDNNSNQQESLF